MPVSPKEKYWASAEYTFPRFWPWMAISGRASPTATRAETWDSIDAIQDYAIDDR